MSNLLVAELARSFGIRGETPKVLATSATVRISKLNVDAALIKLKLFQMLIPLSFIHLTGLL